MPYESEITQLDPGRVLGCRLRQNGDALTWSSVIERWQNDPRFLEFFISILADAPFRAYFWETPPLTDKTLVAAFEFVLVNSDQLSDVEPDQLAFTNHFNVAQPTASVTRFENLGGDAILVVPCPRGPVTAYSQLANFAREAPADQQHELWKLLGATLQDCVGREPVWLNTSGLGVYWLHIRIDSTPKYYTYDPYRSHTLGP